jgi:hypothetical protein
MIKRWTGNQPGVHPSGMNAQLLTYPYFRGK